MLIGRGNLSPSGFEISTGLLTSVTKDKFQLGWDCNDFSFLIFFIILNSMQLQRVTIKGW